VGAEEAGVDGDPFGLIVVVVDVDLTDGADLVAVTGTELLADELLGLELIDHGVASNCSRLGRGTVTNPERVVVLLCHEEDGATRRP
jgi:hypothetical protein